MSTEPRTREHDEADREHQFPITCMSCGRERSNFDGDCSCGSTHSSHSSADATRWNRYVDWRAR